VKAAIRAIGALSVILAAGVASAEDSSNVFVPYPEVTEQAVVETPSLAAALEGEYDLPASPEGEYVVPASHEGQLVQISDTDNIEFCDCCPDCCPLWTVRAGAAILHRSKPDDNVIATSPGGLFEIVAGGDFSFGWDSGVDIYAARQLGNCYGIEARYFNVDSRAGFDNNLTVDLNFGGGISINILDVDSVYQSNLDSAELNMRIDSSPRVTWLAGFRYVDLQEVLDYKITEFVFFDNDVRWRTTNHLYGGQMGADLNLWNLNSPLRINSILKAGIYGNDAENRFRFDPAIGPTLFGGGNSSDVAFVGEIDINVAYQMTQHFALTGGYQLMWINGVALASDQAGTTFASSDVNVITTSGDLFYNGALVGAIFTW
jgi:Putative beta barrel porin-7 (BBP7)